MKKAIKKKQSILYILIALLLFTAGITYHQMAHAWGFWGHRRINRLAVFTLPPEMIGFYKKNIEYLTEHAVDPDKRRYSTKDEAPRHYIDVDHYGEYPFEMVPRKWDDAVEKYTEDTLKAYGIVPWHLEVMLRRLTYAFEKGDSKRILRLSAEIGHYTGDAHVPLHTTLNYNGQLTGQKGIHGFWESRLPELYGDDFDYWVGNAKYLDDPNPHIWEFVLESHAALDSVLGFERKLNDTYPSDQKVSYETRGQRILKTYSEGYSKAYLDMLDDMVERRMRKAILNVGSFWFTAWVNAGQPNLNKLDKALLTEEEKKEQELLEKDFNSGAINGRDHGN